MSKWSSAYRDSRWQQKRLEIMQRDGFRCKSCAKNGPDANLCVHHIYYEQGKAPWEYPDDALITWCDECHSARHEKMREIGARLAQLGKNSFGGASDLLLHSSGRMFNALSYCPSAISLLEEMACKMADIYLDGVALGAEPIGDAGSSS